MIIRVCGQLDLVSHTVLHTGFDQHKQCCH